VTSTSPTVRQRELGKRLRELRNERDLTIEDVAERLLCSPTKISRLETGARRPSLRDVRDLCGLYDVENSASAQLMDLARQARAQGWWAEFDDLNLYPYIGLEQEAKFITCYSMYYVPGLLQTAEYAQEIITAISPKMDRNIQRQRVEARLRRQQLLEEDKPPGYRVLLDEAVLHRQVGGPTLMAAQLSHLLEAGRRGKVTFQVVPFELGAHAAQDSNFVLLEFEEDSNLSPVVFVESLLGGHYFERKPDIIRYREAVDHLRDSALSPRDSVQRVRELREKYGSQ
jgi:transcriptional regulator with XRE-family HTH domain